MRNSSLVEWLGAEDSTGLKFTPKLRQYLILGRGAFLQERSMTERTCGLAGRENAGMSSANYVRIIVVENPRFLEEGLSSQG